jgi:hypothetical protein
MNHRAATVELACMHVLHVAAAHGCVQGHAIPTSNVIATALVGLDLLVACNAATTAVTMTSAPLIHSCSGRAIST